VTSSTAIKKAKMTAIFTAGDGPILDARARKVVKKMRMHRVKPDRALDKVMAMHAGRRVM
jgi:hypothetical protein